MGYANLDVAMIQNVLKIRSALHLAKDMANARADAVMTANARREEIVDPRQGLCNVPMIIHRNISYIKCLGTQFKKFIFLAFGIHYIY